ncbi:hypothetical protein BDZ45DRAFT_509865 [Acephala macrosclerotiorum]|nr:hypothetical protein BDZ45DRAFT_509865 [Acephala macrosclerotiorum]
MTYIVQKKCGSGFEEDLSSWEYFGLVTPDEVTCELDQDNFTPLDKEGRRIRGYTTLQLDEIRNQALDLINEFQVYDIMRNNCQDFASTLFLLLAKGINSPYNESMIEILSEGRILSTPLLRITPTEEHDINSKGGQFDFKKIEIKNRRGEIITLTRRVQCTCVDKMLKSRLMGFGRGFGDAEPA